MCETTRFVNTVGALSVASRAHIVQACDSLRSQGQSITTHVGLSRGEVYPVEEPDKTIVEALLEHVNDSWSTMIMRTRPFSDDLIQHTHPNHQVLLSSKPHCPGCHQWRPMQPTINVDVKELQPDVIVERYLDAKYYHYDPEDIYELGEYNVYAENVAESDDIVTMQFVEADEYSATASLNDNFQELEKTVPEWEQDTKVVHPKWLEHHQSGQLAKDPGCPVCMEEAGSKINPRRKKGDRSPGVMHCDLAALMDISIVWLLQ